MIEKYVRCAGNILKRYSPQICTTIGVIGMIGATVISVRNTPKAMRLIDEKERKLKRAVTTKEAVETTWKLYAAPVVMSAASIALIFAGAKVNAIRSAAVEAVAANATNALREYKKTVKETVPEKVEEVENKVAEKKLNDNPIENTNAVITGNGTHLCYDEVFGVYFRSDRNTIDRAVNEVNRKMVSYQYCSVNDLYDELNIPTIGIGDDLGWTIDEGGVEIDYRSMIATNGEPCIVISYTVKPRFGYSDF